MSIEVTWFNEEKTAIHWVFEGDWVWADVENAAARAEAMFAGVNHTVHSVIEFRGGRLLPADFLSNVLGMFSRPAMSSPNAGLQILVDPPRSVSAIAGVVRKVSPQAREKLCVVASLDEARALAAGMGQTGGAQA
jgi:hypothetical protein